jgi:Sec-independent protein secretion pathway component TatC
MTTAASHKTGNGSKPAAKGPQHHFHPDEFRMTIGEHLEELRMRMILSLMGFAVAAVVCFIYGEKVVWYFLKPLMNAMAADGFSPQAYTHEVGESFMVFIKISMVTAATFASPWMIYQLWLFVAAGLFPHERKYITKYWPLSVSLMAAGMLFLYFVVLPLMLKFFVAFNIGPSLVFKAPIDPNAPHNMSVTLPILDGDPPNPRPGVMWYDATQHRLKFCIGTSDSPEVRVIPYGSADIVSPQIALQTYIDMVIGMLLSFGLAFQTPLIVLALVRIGIFEVDQLKAMRRYVYFSTAIIAGFIVPDVVGGMIALMIPLMLLFELGLWLAREPGQSTGLRQWIMRRLAHLRESIRTRGLGPTFQKPLTWAGTLLLAALLFHVIRRSRQEPVVPVTPVVPGVPVTQPTTAPQTSVPATNPATTQPATANPATAPGRPPTQPAAG